jgi:hypothetical protein
MNRWRLRLAELQDGSPAPPSTVQNVRNVQKSKNRLPSVDFEHSEHFEQDSAPAIVPPEAWADEQDVRAVIGAQGPARSWAEGLARLDPAMPPADVPPQRWIRFIADCARFLGDGWAERAAALGWGPLDLFGCDRERPFARIDHQGLLWFLGDASIMELHRDKAIIEKPTGARQTYRRRPVELGRVVPAWER